MRGHMSNLTAKPKPSLLTPDEFYNAMGKKIGKNSIYEGIASERIRSIRFGRKILVPASEVEDFPRREIGAQ